MSESSNISNQSILLVDDDTVFINRFERAFKQRNFTTYAVGDYDSAVRICKTKPTDWAIVDLKLPGKNGLELVTKILEIVPKMKIVVLTGYGSIATAMQAVRIGAIDYLTKPVDVDQILSAFLTFDNKKENASMNDFSPLSLDRIEWEHINRVLELCEGNITKASEALGIHRRSLQRKLAKFAPNR